MWDFICVFDQYESKAGLKGFGAQAGSVSLGKSGGSLPCHLDAFAGPHSEPRFPDPVKPIFDLKLCLVFHARPRVPFELCFHVLFIFLD